MASQEEFALEGFQFRLKPLPVLDSMDLLPKVLETWPAIMAIHAAKESANGVQGLAALARVFSKARPIVEAFLGACEMRTTGDPSPSPHYQPMSGIYSNLMQRQQMLMLSWMMKCVGIEYADFLAKARQEPKPSEPATS